MKSITLLLAICMTTLTAGCGNSGGERDSTAFLADLKDTQQRTGYDDAKLLAVGDAMCEMAKVSATDVEYVLELDNVMRTSDVPGTGGSAELALISGNALVHLCPDEGKRLQKK